MTEDDTKSEGSTSQLSSTDPSKLVTNSMGGVTPKTKTDEITAVQDSIDRLSLAMFEALRGLRDAVAPESGNAAASHGDNSDPDFEEFYTLFRNGDKDTVDLVLKAGGGVAPTAKDDFIRIHARIEMTKDVELVSRLATTVLQKSADVDARVAALPGMNRTRTEQMQRIEDLMTQNQTIDKELHEQYALAKERRDQVRKLLRERTGEALGIEDIGD